MLRQAANDVMLRINDVGLRSVARHKAELFNDVALGANGMFQTQKSLTFRGFSCFKGILSNSACTVFRKLIVTKLVFVLSV